MNSIRLGGVCSIQLSYVGVSKQVILSLIVTHYSILKIQIFQGDCPINARLGGGRSIRLSYWGILPVYSIGKGCLCQG